MHISDSARPVGLRAAATTAAPTPWLWLLPFIVALGYPFFLASFHGQFAAAHAMTALAWLEIACAYAVPALALAVAHRLRAGGQTPQALLGARLAQAVVVAPPLFTLLGVLLYLMKIDGHDGAVWSGLLAVLMVGGALAMYVRGGMPVVTPAPAALRRHARLRAVHGVSALLLLAVFLLPHLFNHLGGLWGVEAHRAIMKLLRLWYRQGLLEPLIVACFFFQILSGLVLLRQKSAASVDFIDTLQTASGLYLAVFIAGHINSVFTLGRYFGSETDFAWAVGAPTGLLADAWNIRLLPHYSLALFFLVAHAACATRLILRRHGASEHAAKRLVWSLVGAGLLLSVAISAGMLGARVG